MNVAWCSEDNPIETFIGYFKRIYYKEKLRVFCNPNLNGRKNLNDARMEDLVESALSRI